MNTDLDATVNDDELDVRLRSAFATMMPLLDPSADAATATERGDDDSSGGPGSPLVFDLPRRPERPDRRRLVGILGTAAATMMVVAGLVAVQSEPVEQAGVSDVSDGQPQASEMSAPLATTSVTDSTLVDYDVTEPVPAYRSPGCETGTEAGCNPYVDLAVTGGASDFYVGPERLGTPQVALSLFDRLIRCAQLDEAGTACKKLEGFAGVGVTRYPSDVTVDTTDVFSADALDVEIGTTFTDISPTAYATPRGQTGDGLGDLEKVVVRGHDAIAYSSGGSRYVVWQERPGALVWVKAASDAPDDLLAVAEEVRRIPGPTTIPWLVVVPDETRGQSYDATSNDSDTLLIGLRADGTECVGFGYIDPERSCGGSITHQTFVRIIGDRALVTGITPATVRSVRVSQEGVQLAVVDTRPIEASDKLLFSTFVDVEGIVDVEWVDESGNTTSTTIEIDFCRLACG